VTCGLAAHYVTVSAEPDAAAAWDNLRFGRFAETGVRDTSPPAVGNTRRRSNVEVRRAGPDDAETVTALVMEFFHSLAAPPMFVPCMAESARAQRQLALDHLADPACPCWLACIDGRPVSMQLFIEPGSPHWHISALQAPDDGVCLFLACTMPEMRSAGVGAALFAHHGLGTGGGVRALRGALRDGEPGRGSLAWSRVPAGVALVVSRHRRAGDLGTRYGVAWSPRIGAAGQS
jgi:hypothetical protein